MSTSDSPLESVRLLVERLEDRSVRYCHWKSNQAIERSERAENDLDILVEPEQVDTFTAVMDDLGYKIARPRRSRRVPGLVDHLGLDPDSGRLVQVQRHDRLVLGDDATKNYRLPIESEYLRDLMRPSLLPVPRPVCEYLVFLIRMGIKHCPIDAIGQYEGRLSQSERHELRFLEERVTMSEVGAAATQLLTGVDQALLERVRAAIEPGTGITERAAAGFHLERALGRYRLRPWAIDFALRIVRRPWRRLTRRRWGHLSKKRLDAGGAVVAIIGGDGSGKSSTVSMLAEWLAPQLDVRTIHLGKPPRSVLRRLVERLPHRPDAIAALLLAIDRLRSARRAHRWARDGAIVISDRYPLPWIDVMDWCRIGSGWAARFERGIYRRMGEPDIPIVLRVTPDIAVGRRPEQDPGFVHRRAEAVAEASWPPDFSVVDADLPQTAVHDRVRTLVWSRL